MCEVAWCCACMSSQVVDSSGMKVGVMDRAEGALDLDVLSIANSLPPVVDVIESQKGRSA